MRLLIMPAAILARSVGVEHVGGCVTGATMKDLVEKVLPYLPKYLADLGALLVSPRRFIARKRLLSEETFGQALVFAAVSIAVTVLATTPLYPGKDIWARMGGWVIGCLVNGALLSLALHTAWRVVGGRVPLRGFFVVYAYFYGALTILFGGSLLLSLGLVRALEPGIHAWFLQHMSSPLSLETLRQARRTLQLTVEAASSLRWTAVIFVAGQLGLAAWVVVAWGAFRDLNHASRARSMVAFVIAVALALPCLLAGMFVANAMV
jgi:hypothetical protein